MAGVIISGDTSGSVTLQAPAVAGSTTLTLPATSGTILQSGTVVTEAQGGNGTTTGYYGFKNRIINGAMVIDQRNAGVSVTPINNQYTLDRYYSVLSQASKYTVQQSTTAPAGFINSLKVTSSSAYSIGAGDYFALYQAIEGLNVADLAWGTANAKPVTLSFQVYSSLTGTFGGVITNSATDRSYPYTYTISSANTWTSISVTIAGDTSGTWLTTNGVGLRVSFGLGVGSTYSGTAGSWAGALYISATGATSVVGTNGATFYITGVQLEKGSTATSFDYRPYGQELLLCQRYYQFYDAGVVTGSVSGNAYGVSATCTVVPRTTPTVSWVSPTLGVNGYPTTTPNITDIKAYSCLVWMSANATLTGSSWQNRVAFSAEL
jgi:hypothetical protein